MRGSHDFETDAPETMEPNHFDATTEYLRRQRGGQFDESTIRAARYVLVEGLKPGAALARVKEELGLDSAPNPNNLSNALNRYPAAFKAMVAASEKQAVTVVVTPRVAKHLIALDAEEVEEIVERICRDKPKKGE